MRGGRSGGTNFKPITPAPRLKYDTTMIAHLVQAGQELLGLFEAKPQTTKGRGSLVIPAESIAGSNRPPECRGFAGNLPYCT